MFRIKHNIIYFENILLEYHMWGELREGKDLQNIYAFMQLSLQNFYLGTFLFASKSTVHSEIAKLPFGMQNRCYS